MDRRRRLPHALVAATVAFGSIAVAGPGHAVVTPVGFDAPVPLDSGSIAYSTTIADVTDDGLLDLIVGNTGLVSESADYTLQVFVQQGNGTLAAPVGYVPTKAEGATPSLITAAGHLDGDTDIDVATGTEQGVDVFLQDAGVLTGPTNYPSPDGEVLDVQVADLNADGRDDLIYTVSVATSPGDYQVVRRTQNDTGTFDAADVLATYAAASTVTVAVGDVSGDGRADVVVGDGSGDGIHALVQQEDGSFSQTTDPRLTNVKVAMFGDVTGDGLDDLVVLRAASLRVMAAVAGDALAAPVSYPAGGVTVEAADLNGDGDTDLATFGETGTALLFQDAGSLSEPCAAPDVIDGSIGGKEITAVGDLNGDQAPDVAVGGVSPTVTLMTGFSSGETYPTTLWLGFESASTIDVGGSVSFSGTLGFQDGCLDGGAEVQIWRSTGGGDPVEIAAAPLVESVDGAGFTFQDTPPSAGTFTYRAVFDGGAVLGGAQSAQLEVVVQKLASSLSLAVSDRTLRVGESTLLTAALSGPDEGRISFYAKVDGTTRRVDTVRTNDRGKATLKVTPKRHTTYTARYAATKTYVGSVSDRESVKVAAEVHGEMRKYERLASGTAIYRCCRAWFLTWVQPPKPGQPVKVTVQYWDGGAWKTLAAEKDTFKLNADGKALIFLDIQGGAGFRFRARATWKSDGLNSGGSSRWVSFKLTV